MRIAKLSLLAFGPFTQGELGFAPKLGTLDLVYGPNEAGKSTSLRALTALLYGIPSRTQDAHLHDMPRLRVGATLVDHHGRSFSFVRRKGQKQTLLDGNEDPVGEEVLAGLLGSLDAGMFRQMFGLDHERLRAGAEALLSGGGNVSESLFDAGSGARAIRTVLEGLKLEADELFKVRGPTTKLQMAVRALRDSQKARKEAMLSPQAFSDQRKGLSEARAQLEAHLSQRQALLREKSRLDRALSVLPLLARQGRLLEERASLGTPPRFDDGASEQRASLEARLSAEERECVRLESELGQVTEALAQLKAPAPQALDHELVRELEQRFGSYRKAQMERPRLLGELEALEADVGLLRERSGGALGALHKLDTPSRRRLRTRAEEERTLTGLQHELEEQGARLALLLEGREQALAELGPTLDTGELEAAIERAERDERAHTLPRLEGEQRERAEQLDRGLAQLGLGITRAALASLALPGDAELEESERGLAQARVSAERVAAELKENDRLAHALASERTLLFASGQVLTEAHLSAARELRASRLAELCQALRTGQPGRDDALLAFREQERQADDVADRLRREASRTHALLRIELEERQLAEQRARLLSERSEASAELERERLRSERLLAPLGVTSHGGARARLQKLEALRERAGGLASLEGNVAELRERVSAHCLMLAEASGKRAHALSDAITLAKAELRVRERRVREQREASLRRDQARSEARELAHKLEHTRARRAAFAATLAGELAALGFGAGLSADEALASADELGALEGKQREARSLRQSLELLELESKTFARELEELCAQHVPEARGVSVAEAMAQVVAAQRRAHEAARERERCVERAEKLAAELKLREQARRALGAERDRYFAQGGVSSFAALRELEQRAKRAAELDAALAQLELELATLSEGMSSEALRSEVRAVDPDEARARLVTLEAELETLSEEIDGRNQEIGGLQAGLEQLRRESGAVSLAEETESQLARVRALTKRYAEVRVGHALLAREVERYRAAHQGPVLARASALFPRLTLERYQRLEVTLDEADQPTLVCVRADGKNVRVAGLSDGTRDQLYLALRIASIERYLDHNPPMPLLLDDAFVHFDDARSQAALSVLGELSARTQVIFFTHHARMLELAKKAVGKDKVLVHELDPAHGVVRTRDNGPLFARV